MLAAGIALSAWGGVADETKAELPILGWLALPENQPWGVMPRNLATVKNYRIARDGGFTHLMQWADSLDAAKRCLENAEKAGIKLSVHSSVFNRDAARAARELKGYKALAMYHICDEPKVQDMPRMGEIARAIMAEDPDHWCYMNWFGVVGKDPMRWYGTTDFRSYIRTSLKEVPIQMISFDKYPLIVCDHGETMPPFRNLAGESLKTNWFETLEIVREVSRETKKPFWAFAISSAHALGNSAYSPGKDGRHLYPVATVPAMKLQQYANLAYGAQGLQYYSYYPPTGAGYCYYHAAPVTGDAQTTPVFDRVREVNAELQARARVFVGADAVGVWHTGPDIPVATRRLTPSDLPAGVETLETDEGAIVSHLVNGARRYLMVVNRTLGRELTLKIAFADGVSRIRKDGTAVPAANSCGEYWLETGDAEIFELP